MTRVLVAALLLSGCYGTPVSIRMDVPAGATALIKKGVYTPAVAFATPFVGRFESGNLNVAGGFPIEFKLEPRAAAKYGADHEVTIYARLNVAKPTEFTRTQTLRLAPSEERIRALIRGEVSEISAFVADPSEEGQPRLCTVVMRMTPF
jgi:hypothetical protein